MKRRDEVLVGIFLTVAVAIALLGTLWLVRGGLSSGYPLYSKFAWGQNLKPGQPVLLAGVNVGAVADVTLRDDGFPPLHYTLVWALGKLLPLTPWADPEARVNWPAALAIAVVKDDSVVFAKGYGVLQKGSSQPANEHTRFAIGSTTKAMTSASIDRRRSRSTGRRSSLWSSASAGATFPGIAPSATCSATPSSTM